MPYHIKTPKTLGTGDLYWKGDNTWTETYSDRKQYSSESDANTQAATTVTRTIGDKTYTYQPNWWKNSTVVSE
jgi:hypothetical protein